MRRLLFSIVAAIWLVSSAAAFAAGIDMDVVCYYGDGELTYTELNVGIQRSSILYNALGDDSVAAEFTVIVSLSRNDTTFLSDTLDTKDRARRDSTASTGAYFPYVFRYLLTPGEYDVLVELRQERAQLFRSMDDLIQVPKFGEETPISDLALGAELEFGAEPSRYTKNSVKFVPNPSRFYGSEMPMLYYYVELYGLNGDSSSTDSLTVTRMVVASDRGEFAKNPSVRKFANLANSMVVADGFPAYTLHTGTYKLKLEIDCPGQPARKVSKKCSGFAGGARAGRSPQRYA